ncbi:MAG: DNA repair protein RecO [Chloroflexi bacterium]|nr:DNA repair protein RecO [Chloroflexota bacterium]
MPRERTFRSEAIVLKRIDFGEADRLLTLYSREQGKIKAIAKGARKPQSRKTGHVELFMRSKFLFAKGKNLDIITQAEMVEPYAALRTDLVRMTYASYAVELLDRFTVEEDKHVDIYQLLAEALGWFAGDEDVLLTSRFYELRLLSLTGFRPQLFTCVSCGEAITEQDQYFSAELGGLLCPNCFNADRRAADISAVAVKVLRYLQTRPYDTIKSLQLRRPVHTELERLMHFYLTYILERNLKSVDFLHRLRREADLFAPPES